MRARFLQDVHLLEFAQKSRKQDCYYDIEMHIISSPKIKSATFLGLSRCRDSTVANTIQVVIFKSYMCIS